MEKKCPLCQRPAPAKWPNGGDVVLEPDHINDFRFCGYTFEQVRLALRFALAHGWKEKKDDSLGR